MKIPNSINISEEAISTLRPREREVREEPVEFTLSSDLLMADQTLHRVAIGRITIRSGRNQRGHYVRRVNIALKIVLPEMEGITQSEIHSLRSWTVSNLFDQDSEAWTMRFQELKDLDADGVVGKRTIHWLDVELNKIRYYTDAQGQEKTIHNASKAIAIGEFYRVSERTLATIRADQEILESLSQDLVPRAIAESTDLQNHLSANIANSVLEFDGEEWWIEVSDAGLDLRIHFAKYTRPNNDVYIHVFAASTYLRTEPLSSGKPLYRVVEGERVLVLQKFDDWLYVTLDDGSQGYLRSWDIWMKSPMPEPNAQLYRIRDTDTIQKICTRKYGVDLLIDGMDERFFAAVLLLINNPKGENEGDVSIYTEESLLWDLNVIWEIVRSSSPLLATLDISIDYLVERLREDPRYGPGYVLPAFNEYHIKKKHHLWLPSRDLIIDLRKWIKARQIVAQGTPLQAILNFFRDLSEESFIEKFRSLWPVGLGIRIDAMVGATFGIPLGVDASINCYMYHEVTQYGEEQDKHIIRVVRRGKVAGGLDTGIGYGAWVNIGALLGFGKDPRKKNPGIGAKLGVNLKRFGGLQIHQEMVFPIDSLPPIIALVNSVTSMGGAFPKIFAEMIPIMFDFFNVDPNDYTTKIELSLMKSTIAAAEGELGLRFGSQNEGSVWNSDERDEIDFSKGDGSIMYYLAKKLSITTGLGLDFEIGSALEFAYSDFKVDNESLNYYPQKNSVTVKYEGELAAGLRIPVLRKLGIVIGGGFGLKFSWDYDENQVKPDQEQSRQFKEAFLIVYSKSDDVDIWEGPAHEVRLEFKLNHASDSSSAWLNPQTFLQKVGSAIPTSVSDFQDSFVGVKVRIRLGATSALSSLANLNKFNDFVRFRKSMPIFIKHDRKSIKSPFLGVYLECEWDSQEKDKIRAIIDDIVNKEGQQVREAFSFLAKYIEVGQLPEKCPELLASLYQELESVAITPHVEFGIGVNAGGIFGAFAKVRGRLMIHGAGFWRQRYTIANATEKINKLYEIFGVDGDRPDLSLMGLNHVVAPTRSKVVK